MKHFNHHRHDDAARYQQHLHRQGRTSLRVEAMGGGWLKVIDTAGVEEPVKLRASAAMQQIEDAK